MSVLYLGPPSPVLTALLEVERQVGWTQEPLTAAFLATSPVDWLVSYGYRHKVPADVLAAVKGRAINLHISYLPDNRGAHPNVWAWYDGTRHGVSIHYMDDGIDTGDLIVQQELHFGEGETLASSYARLTHDLQALFPNWWARIRHGSAAGHRQPPGGRVHRAADLERIRHLLTDGWDTPGVVLRDAGQRAREREGEPCAS